MYTNKTELEMSKIEALETRMEKTRALLTKMEADHAELRLAMLRTVDLTKVGETFTLTYKDRIIKAKKNRYGRFRVTEGKKVLDNDLFCGIHDLRFSVAMSLI
jgi:hypothetical protein